MSWRCVGNLRAMAVYEFRCRTCDDLFELRRPMSESDAPAECPQGHADTVRLLSVFASAGVTAGSGGEMPAGGCGPACACAANR
jgi:putative FmdB family regulatory protein